MYGIPFIALYSNMHVYMATTQCQELFTNLAFLCIYMYLYMQLDQRLSERRSIVCSKLQNRIKERRRSKAKSTLSAEEEERLKKDHSTENLQLEVALLTTLSANSLATKQLTNKSVLASCITWDAFEKTAALDLYDRDVEQACSAVVSHAELDEDADLTSLRVAQQRVEEEVRIEKQCAEQIRVSIMRQAGLGSASQGDVTALPHIVVGSKEAELEKTKLVESQIQQQVQILLVICGYYDSIVNHSFAGIILFGSYRCQLT